MTSVSKFPYSPLILFYFINFFNRVRNFKTPEPYNIAPVVRLSGQTPGNSPDFKEGGVT